MANKNETRDRPHGLPECASLHPGYDFCDVMARSEDEADMPFPAHRRRHRIGSSALSRLLKGSLQTPLSQSFLASEPILCRREAIGSRDRA